MKNIEAVKRTLADINEKLKTALGGLKTSLERKKAELEKYISEIESAE